jgi:hypothetical protein
MADRSMVRVGLSWGRRVLIGIWTLPQTLNFAFLCPQRPLCSSDILATSYMPALYLSECCFFPLLRIVQLG